MSRNLYANCFEAICRLYADGYRCGPTSFYRGSMNAYIEHLKNGKARIVRL